MEVPAGVNVTQVLLYWEGLHEQGTSGDNTLEVDGNTITGDLIGGPTFYY